MITCSACGYENQDNAEFCDACGSELQPVVNKLYSPEAPTVVQAEIIQPPIAAPTQKNQPIYPPQNITQPTFPSFPSFPSTTTTARLISKQPNPPVAEFTLEPSNLIGIFDPEMGPVEIDLEVFLGSDTVSRHHGEIYLEGGVWKVKDTGSTNGIFIKPAGQARFNARITTPETLNPGDEIAFAKVRFVFQSP